MNLSLTNPITSVSDSEIQGFLIEGLTKFKEELEHYIEQCKDTEVLGYASEVTLSCLFTYGLLRNNPKVTALQEYSLTHLQDNSLNRPDIFINYQQNAIWIESKKIPYSSIGENHWDIPSWISWDTEYAFKQAERYYSCEQRDVNKSFKRRYVMTLCFKSINQNPEEFLPLPESNLRNKISEKHDRDWFYYVFFLPKEGKKILQGLEVYGTIREEIKLSCN